MVSARVLQLLGLACLASVLPIRGNDNHLIIAPQSPVLEIGTNFTATCMIISRANVTVDELCWSLSKTIIPKEQYTKVNTSAFNVTLQITNEEKEWLFCHCNSSLANVLHSGKFVHGILLRKGYRPQKPENLSCVALQEKDHISKTMTCQWDALGRQTSDVPIKYTLYLNVYPVDHRLTAEEELSEEAERDGVSRSRCPPRSRGTSSYNVTTTEKRVKIDMGDAFPDFMELEIWVEAHNSLGREESEHLRKEAGYFVKTNPPTAISAISEQAFPTSLLMNWTSPLNKGYTNVMYEIRFRTDGSHSWNYVPLREMTKDKKSFRIQDLKPDTLYDTQVRSKISKDYGYWSEWSHSAINRTPEAPPASGPDVWRSIYNGVGISDRRVQLLCKDPELSNGKIIWFDLRIHGERGQFMNESSEWERILVNRSDEDYRSTQRRITVLKEITLADRQSIRVDVKAANSAGESIKTTITIPERATELPPVERLTVRSQGGQLWLQWHPPKEAVAVSEYVVEWVTGDKKDWQRVAKGTKLTAIKGNLEKYVSYTVFVYPIYTRKAGKAVSMEAFLEQGVPKEAPPVNVDGKVGRKHAELTWKPLPPDIIRGFITNYTIFYRSDTEERSACDGSSRHHLIHFDLTVPNTSYRTWIRVSTIAGSATGSKHSFTTAKYEDRMIELIVVGVSLGFLFVVVMTMLLCVYKRDAIKRNFWPQIPNPGESTIGTWSPDYPLKVRTCCRGPKENSLSGISVLDVCDTKSVFEEDKTSLPLKKDKYLSEEHSSGIGGSSCMSSPRQSVSDSDEGGDIADTTASTVQYSSVVASSGYKGQTPSSQAQQAIFSRSESTQPLLDSEENPDVLVHERFPRQPCFSRAAGIEDDTNQLEAEQQVMLEPLDFCSLEEDSETANTDEHLADWLTAAPASSYMPQLGGYRPQ
ncbi:hypothetical protein INR49_023458 [Caranx melampygus]|nr:hypothetical protein INR49_023458 [Caranx melampygus]